MGLAAQAQSASTLFHLQRLGAQHLSGKSCWYNALYREPTNQSCHKEWVLFFNSFSNSTPEVLPAHGWIHLVLCPSAKVDASSQLLFVGQPP